MSGMVPLVGGLRAILVDRELAGLFLVVTLDLAPSHALGSLDFDTDRSLRE